MENKLPSYMTKEKNPSQIIRFDGENCFVEVMSYSFAIGKVVLNFQQNTPQATKLFNIPIYMDISKFLVFMKDVEFGYLQKKLLTEKQRCLNENISFPNAQFQLLGGTSKEMLALKGKSRPDGQDESRVLSISPATRSATMDLFLQAEQGPGEQQDGKLIKPKFNYKDKENYKRIMVPMTYENLKELVFMTYVSYIGYVASNWTQGKYTSQYKNENTDTTNS